jgi:hypothetical protein
MLLLGTLLLQGLYDRVGVNGSRGACIAPPAPGVAATTSRVPDEPPAPVVPTVALRDKPSGIAPLCDFVVPRDATTLDHALPAPARGVRYVHVNAALFRGKASPFWQPSGVGRVEMSLPDGGAVVVTIQDSELLGPDRFVSTGVVEGHPGARALFAWNAGFLHASLDDPLLGNFALRTATSDLAQVYRVDPALVPPCGGERRPGDVLPPRSGAAQAGGPASSVVDQPAAAALENPQHAEIHVLMLYTSRVLDTLRGPARPAALQSAFDLAISRVNAAFAASQITARVKLVGIAETDYDEEASTDVSVQKDAHDALYRTDDGKMDEIHALRDRVGADIVCLALGRRDFSISGLSFLLNTTGNNDNADYAFSVVDYASITGTNVVAHEFGHLLGCAHDRPNAVSGQGAYPYSYGYRFLGANGLVYHDIMAYEREYPLGPIATELSYFSNPRIVAPAPINVPLGIAAGLPGESDNALTIEQNAFAAASFRRQTQAPAGAGSLINVATRGFVGPGDQALIAGFVIDGAEPRHILIRAAGPALAGFGVKNALADPLLRIFSGATLAAENDNWAAPSGAGRPTAAAELVNAAASVQAFPFLPGSADAAVLVTLPPGAYTAVVEGARGSNGIGLVEAYDVNDSSDRFIALATRGYADRTGKEIYAGFVVQGEPNATKRVLIRALGPSLSRPPFNLTDVLEDPELELRNAVGDILLRSDDWTTGSEGGISLTNDFHPLVKSHGEQEIFATGHAPGNRREPCVLVDLPPGNYSVIVRPFELRDADPQRDQPAQPGVTVVEVYELAR